MLPWMNNTSGLFHNCVCLTTVPRCHWVSYCRLQMNSSTSFDQQSFCNDLPDAVLERRLGQCFMKPAQGLGTTSLPKALNTGNISTFKPLHSKSAAVNSNLGAAVATGQPAKPLWQHDPHTEGAVILNDAQWKQAGDKHGVTPVVVDPYIGRKLRPHQCHGVQFLYECVMGLREANRQVWVLCHKLPLHCTDCSNPRLYMHCTVRPGVDAKQCAPHVSCSTHYSPPTLSLQHQSKTQPLMRDRMRWYCVLVHDAYVHRGLRSCCGVHAGLGRCWLMRWVWARLCKSLLSCGPYSSRALRYNHINTYS